jgi:tetratricopeptide (TPR) repeat protein
MNPDFAMAYYNRAAAYSHKGQYDKTISDYNKAIEIDPRFAEGFYNRGTIYTEQDQIDIDPKLAEAFNNRGDAYKEKGLCKEAIFDFTKAIEINPHYAHAYNEKAWILATCPDDRYRNGDQAVALAKKAIDMSPKPIYLDTLGASYAEMGQFESAIATQEKVIAEIKKINAEKNLVDGSIERLKFYKAHKPWREIR